MRRMATDNIEFSDGTRIPKGTITGVTAHGMWDSKTYSEPHVWDGRRFLRMREAAGQEHAAQLVSTNPEYLSFGHGQHACPGRFFAANEVKIMLIHFLLKYDWRLPEGAPAPQVQDSGFFIGADAKAKLEYRRRTPEIDI